LYFIYGWLSVIAEVFHFIVPFHQLMVRFSTNSAVLRSRRRKTNRGGAQGVGPLWSHDVMPERTMFAEERKLKILEVRSLSSDRAFQLIEAFSFA